MKGNAKDVALCCDADHLDPGMEGLQSAFSQPKVLHEGLSLARILKDVYVRNLHCQNLSQTSGNPSYPWCTGTLTALSSTIHSHCKRQFCRTHDAFPCGSQNPTAAYIPNYLEPIHTGILPAQVNYVTFLLYNAEEKTPTIKNEITKWFSLKNQIWFWIYSSYKTPSVYSLIISLVRLTPTNCSYVEDNNPCPLGIVASRCEELKMEKEFYVLWSLYLIFSGCIRWLFFQGRWICHCNWKYNVLLPTLVVLPWYVPHCYCITYDGVLIHGISKAVSHWSSTTFPFSYMDFHLNI